LNGIDYHPDGYLIVALARAGALYKVPVDDPAASTPVELSEPVSIDGMIFHPNGDLVAVATIFDANGNPKSEIVVLHSEDDWASAEIEHRADSDASISPTTATLREGAVYVVHAHFGDLEADTAQSEFEIIRFDFEFEEMMGE
jgi:hypothetical protein